LALVGVVSPYDVHARDAVADAAVCLLSRAVTLLPTPLEGVEPEAIAEAVEDVPAFGRLMESWRWSSPLWHAGVLTPALDASAGWPIEWVRGVAQEISEGPEGALRSVVGASRFEDTLAYLNSICRDLTKGGSDPGMSVPVTAGLSRYAATHGLVEFTGEHESTVSKLERRRMRPLGRVTLAVPRLMDGEEVIAVRERAGAELEAMGEALRSALFGGARWETVRGPAGEAVESVRHAVRIVDDRARAALVSVTFGVSDGDVVLRAARKASTVASRVVGRGTARGRSDGEGGVETVVSDPGAALARPGVVRAVVRVLPFVADEDRS